MIHVILIKPFTEPSYLMDGGVSFVVCLYLLNTLKEVVEVEVLVFTASFSLQLEVQISRSTFPYFYSGTELE